MRVLVTGSADGLGRAAAAALVEDGHEVVVHVRSDARRAAVTDIDARVVVGDLADDAQTRDVAAQADAIGRMDAVIHNAGVMSGPVLAVNVLAPYLLTALIARPSRLVVLSSGMHRGGRADLAHLDRGVSYSDSKLLVTALTLGLARRWPAVLSNAVDPGWVPTRMGGTGAPDDLTLGHVTQAWLATSDDAEAITSGGYWHHQRRQEPHPAARDERFQDELLATLADRTGVALDR